MDTASPHFGFVVASYALSAAVLIGLLAWTFWNKHKLDAEAARLAMREE